MPNKLLPWLLLVSILSTGCQTSSTKAKPSVSASSDAAAILVGSWSKATAMNTPASSPLASQLGVTVVEIKNDWNGYSDITPIARHYRLLPKGVGLEGNGSFAVGGYGGYGIRQQYTKKIAIDSTLSQQFLQTLSATKITKSARYNPHRTHRDDYPDISIYIKTADREVTFVSRSQGQYNTPWQVRIKTKGKVESFVSNSPNPAQALLLIKAQIDHPGLEQAINKQNKRKASAQPKAVVVNPSQQP